MNLADPAELRRFLASQGIGAAKALGQHFLCSSDVVAAMTSRLSSFSGLLEIGPGPGVLTSPLAAHAEKMIALELDARMVKALKKSAPQAEVRQVDALQADLGAILRELPAPRAVVSNLPYYITAPLVEAIAGARAEYGVAVLMMQKEVAQRITAPPRSGDRGSLSVYLQALFTIEHVANAPAAAFEPPPKVDSTVLAFTPNGEEPPESLFKFIRTCFAQPRKTLANNLMAGFKVSREAALAALEETGLIPTSRAQELTWEEWQRLRTAFPTP